MKRNNRTLTAVVAVAGVAACGMVVPGAQASYFSPGSSVCNPASDLHGIGASGLRAAQIAWGNAIISPSTATAPALGSGFGYDAGADYPTTCAKFKLPADGGTLKLDYRATGSGSCLQIMGANGAGPRQYTDADPTTGGLVNNISYCGTEDAPTPAQITASEGGPTAVGAAQHPAAAQMITIPVAQVAVPMVVKLPAGCKVTTNRTILREDAEAAFAGTITTWGQIFHGGDMTSTSGTPADNAACRAKTFTRVVRKDKSGTTFLLKRYMQAVSDIPGGSAQVWREDGAGALANDAWPNDTGATAVARGAANGNGSLLDKLNDTTALPDGGIGYADLATARAKGFSWHRTAPGVNDPADTSLWLFAQRIANDTFNSPARSNGDDATGDNVGAACVNVAYTGAPTTDLAASWADATAVPTPDDYPICGLNYIVTSLWGADPTAGAKVWAGSNEGEFRVMKDYLRYLVGVLRGTSGPDKLPAAGYAILPKSIRATARCQVANLGYIRASGDVAPSAAVPRGTCPTT